MDLEDDGDSVCSAASEAVPPPADLGLTQGKSNSKNS